ncbi:MAG: hypothetical protein ABIH50_05540 [bacterium]
MLNIIDIIVAAVIVFYIMKGAGGPSKMVRTGLMVVVFLVIFGIITRLLIDAPLPEPAHKTLKNSYFVKLSVYLIKWGYPAVEKSAPVVDKFIKDKIISMPTPEVTVPKVKIPKVTLPQISQ